MATISPSPEGGRVLFIDAYDSFSENIAAMLSQILRVQVAMIHIDTRIEDLPDTPSTSNQERLCCFLQKFDAVVLGPGPGNPNISADVGLFSEIWRLQKDSIKPVLGICLGFQSLCVTFGASISRLPEPCHGHAKKINHNGGDIFASIGKVFATNYNSLAVRLEDISSSAGTKLSVGSSSSPQGTISQFTTPSHVQVENFSAYQELKPLAWDDFGTLMAVKHVELPYWGLQFHPESCKSSGSCQEIIRNWWKAGMHWSKRMLPIHKNPSLILPSGHTWSRPLTPLPSANASHRSAKDNRNIPTLYEDLLALTASSDGSVQSQVCKSSANASAVANFCRTVSPEDCVMLESTRKGRHSIYALPSPGRCRVEYSLGTSVCTIYRADGPVKEWNMPLGHVLDSIHRLIAAKKAKGGHASLPFWGGFIGLLSYEIGLEGIDVRPLHRETCPDFPDLSLLWVERSIVIDHKEDQAYIQSLLKEDSAWIWEMAHKLSSTPDGLSSPVPCTEHLHKLLASAEIMLPDEGSYKRRIHSCQSYLHSGDSYELCLTTEAKITMPSHPENAWLLYQNLRRHNPVPFSAYLCLGRATILSSSPEQFLTWDRSTGAIDMVPMKGTVAKSASMTPERAREILASPKESAENLMIADLIRHDLYSTVGWNACVEVVKLCEVVEHETVYQLVSHIRATPKIPKSLPSSSSSSSSSLASSSPSPSASSFAASITSTDRTFFSHRSLSPSDRQGQIVRHGHKALRQTLPPGSMTGAPKKRSCEILDRLEERRRGAYSGVLGYLDVGGGGGFSVCIRTAVSHANEDHDSEQKKKTKNRGPDNGRGGEKEEEAGASRWGSMKQTWRIGAGGAITVLSDPDAEWEEMKTKLESVLKAFRPGTGANRTGD